MKILFLSFLAGLLTSLSPCVLPALPLVVGSATQQHRSGPLFLAAGMISAFTIIGVSIASAGNLVGIDQRTLRYIAAIFLLILGVILLSKKLQAGLGKLLSPVARSADKMLQKSSFPGLTGQFLVGVMLGAVWTPCSGPTLGAAISLAAGEKEILQAGLIMFVFSIGATIPLIAVAYLSREAFRRHQGGLLLLAERGKPVFGALLLIVGLAVISGSDKQVEAWLLDLSPDWLTDLTTRF